MLGDPKDQVLAHFKLKPNVDEEVTRKSCGATLTEIHWLDLDHRHNGIWFYLKDNIVFQIRSSTSQFRTQKGITTDSTAEFVRRNYANLKAFRLQNSGNQATGWKDHVYWVGRSSGIAFELYYNDDYKEWKVLSVFIFRPDAEFLPGTCIYPPQEWKEIPPYTF